MNMLGDLACTFLLVLVSMHISMTFRITWERHTGLCEAASFGGFFGFRCGLCLDIFQAVGVTDKTSDQLYIRANAACIPLFSFNFLRSFGWKLSDPGALSSWSLFFIFPRTSMSVISEAASFHRSFALNSSCLLYVLVTSGCMCELRGHKRFLFSLSRVERTFATSAHLMFNISALFLGRNGKNLKESF